VGRIRFLVLHQAAYIIIIVLSRVWLWGIRFSLKYYLKSVRLMFRGNDSTLVDFVRIRF